MTPRAIRSAIAMFCRLPGGSGVVEQTTRIITRSFPRRRFSTVLGYHISWALALAQPNRLRSFRTTDGVSIAFQMDAWDWAYHYFLGHPEPETAAFVRRWLRPEDNVIDVGANIGIYTLLAAAKVGSGGHVYAFEPNPDAAGLLRHAISLNGFSDRVTLSTSALGPPEMQEAELVLSRGRKSTVGGAVFNEVTDPSTPRLPVAMTTLDSYCKAQDIERIRLVKIDVEGFESQVLLGAAEMMEYLRPEAIVCEVQPNDRNPDAITALIHHFASFGYQPRSIAPRGDLLPLRVGTLGRMGLNLCFLPTTRQVPRGR